MRLGRPALLTLSLSLADARKGGRKAKGSLGYLDRWTTTVESAIQHDSFMEHVRLNMQHEAQLKDEAFMLTGAKDYGVSKGGGMRDALFMQGQRSRAKREAERPHSLRPGAPLRALIVAVRVPLALPPQEAVKSHGAR